MAFTAITTSEIAAGQPTKEELFDKIRTNFDDHETRISDTEDTINVFRPIIFSVFGDYDDYTPADGILHDRITFNTTLTSLNLLIPIDGTSGTLTVDVEYKRGVGAWTTILSSPVSIAQGSGDYQVQSGTLAVTSLQSDDLLRLNVDANMVGISEFHVLIGYQKT